MEDSILNSPLSPALMQNGLCNAIGYSENS